MAVCDKTIMESIKLFLKEVTEELLYNIVSIVNEIDYRSLSIIFEKKTGYRPMDFLALVITPVADGCNS